MSSKSKVQQKQKKRVGFASDNDEEVKSLDEDKVHVIEAPTRQSSLKWKTRNGSAVFELKISQEEFMSRFYQPTGAYEAQA